MASTSVGKNMEIINEKSAKDQITFLTNRNKELERIVKTLQQEKLKQQSPPAQGSKNTKDLE